MENIDWITKIITISFNVRTNHHTTLQLNLKSSQFMLHIILGFEQRNGTIIYATLHIIHAWLFSLVIATTDSTRVHFRLVDGESFELIKVCLVELMSTKASSQVRKAFIRLP
uniref:Uncharacterized protein n=1 Tax=Glossina brevipalpis TaxID=37001 RepID=A0A1A9X4T1_9MUSC